MMAKNDNVIGLAIGLDTSSLKAGLQDAGRRLKETSAEFKSSTAGMENWAKTSAGLSSKLNQLNKNLAIQNAALDLMEEEYEKMYKGQDENSAAAVKLRTDILNQKAAISQTEKSIGKFNEQLEEVIEVERKAEKTGKSVNQVLDEQKESATGAGEGFTVLKGTIAGLLATGISKLFGMLSNGAKSLLATTEATREYRTELGQLGAVADTTGTNLDDAKENLKEVVSITSDSGAAVEGLNNLMSAGFKGDALDEVTDQLLAASIKWKDTLKFEGLSDGLQETLATGKAIGPFAEMLERGGMDLEKFNEGLAATTTDAEKQAYILEYLNKMGLTKTLDSYKENNKELIEANKLNQDYLATQAKLGEAMQPVNNALASFKNELMKVILSEVNFEEVSKTLTDVLNKFKDEVLPKVIDGIKWLKDNFDEIKAAVISLGVGFAALKMASIVMGIVKAVKAWTVATKGMTIAQKAMNLAMAANPIGIIITAVIGLITWLTYLYQTNEEFRDKVNAVWAEIKDFFIEAWEAIKIVWDQVKPYFTLLWDYIKNLFSVVKNVLSGNFSEAWESIKKIFGNYKQYFSMIWNGVKSIFAPVGNWFSSKFQEAWSGIKRAFSSIGSYFGGIWNTIKSKFTDIGQKVGNAVSGAFKKAVNSLLSNAEKVLNTPIKAINKLRTIINKVPGIDIDKLSEFKLPRMALGGVVDKATTALIGEDGAEAVVPLERNLGWIKMLTSNIVKEMNLAGVSSGMSTEYQTVYNFSQNITTPKQPPLDDLYRNTKNLLNLKVVNA